MAPFSYILHRPVDFSSQFANVNIYCGYSPQISRGSSPIFHLSASALRDVRLGRNESGATGSERPEADGRARYKIDAKGSSGSYAKRGMVCVQSDRFSLGMLFSGAEMMSLTDDLLSTFGKDFASSEVADVIQRHGLGDIYDDPPFRRYVGSGEKGVDLLFENDKVFDIQIYVLETKTHLSFSDELPFQMQKGMTDKQVHILLGDPESYDAVGSKYTLFDGTAKLTVVYDKSKVVSYLSIRKL